MMRNSKPRHRNLESEQFGVVFRFAAGTDLILARRLPQLISLPARSRKLSREIVGPTRVALRREIRKFLLRRTSTHSRDAVAGAVMHADSDRRRGLKATT